MSGVFPDKIVQYRCPACGRVMDGKTYDIDEALPKCKGKVHKALAEAREYMCIEEGREYALVEKS